MAKGKKAKRRTPSGDAPDAENVKETPVVPETSSAQASSPKAEPVKVETVKPKLYTRIAKDTGVYRVGPAWITLEDGKPVELTLGQIQMLRHKLQPY